METRKDIFDLFMHDETYKYIMKRLLEASMEESFNSVMITEAGPGYPVVYVNPAFCELTGYGPHEVVGKSPSILQGPNTDQEVLDRLNRNIAEGELFHVGEVDFTRVVDRTGRVGWKTQWEQYYQQKGKDIKNLIHG